MAAASCQELVNLALLPRFAALRHVRISGSSVTVSPCLLSHILRSLIYDEVNSRKGIWETIIYRISKLPIREDPSAKVSKQMYP
jgi:hypothetical protein